MVEAGSIMVIQASHQLKACPWAGGSQDKILQSRRPGPSQVSMALPLKMTTGLGVLEYWSIGVLEKDKALMLI